MTGTKPALYVVGWPGSVGGASTKIAHLLRLLHDCFNLTLAVPDDALTRNGDIKRYLVDYKIPCIYWKRLPEKLAGVALAICDRAFFSSGRARLLKDRGLRIVWSNEMMFPFDGEEAAARAGLVDRVLFVSEAQHQVFREIYNGTPAYETGNFVDPEEFPFKTRQNEIFTVGRLSRPDPQKYPLDFPVFYEELGLREVKYRVMAWSPEVQKQYRWHRFGPEWDLLPANKEAALKFLYSLDLFVYPLGHRVKESWGRAVVEAMLTGCVPLVPAGHQFHKLMLHGETGFICEKFSQWRDAVHALHDDYPLRQKIARAASEYAREKLCNAEEHRKRWIEALTF